MKTMDGQTIIGHSSVMGKCQPGQTTQDYPQLDSNTVSLCFYAPWTFVPMRACTILAARRFNMCLFANLDIISQLFIQYNYRLYTISTRLRGNQTIYG